MGARLSFNLIYGLPYNRSTRWAVRDAAVAPNLALSTPQIYPLKSEAKRIIKDKKMAEVNDASRKGVLSKKTNKGLHDECAPKREVG